jgi:hypothetical protein
MLFLGRSSDFLLRDNGTLSHAFLLLGTEAAARKGATALLRTTETQENGTFMNTYSEKITAFSSSR